MWISEAVTPVRASGSQQPVTGHQKRRLNPVVIRHWCREPELIVCCKKRENLWKNIEGLKLGVEDGKTGFDILCDRL